MRKFIAVICSVLLFACILSPMSFAVTTVENTIVGASASESTTVKQSDSDYVLEVDVNKRYSNFANEEVDEIQENENKKIDGKKSVYIAILCAALVVAVVILVVSLKRVPKEEDIDISGKDKNYKE